MPICHLPHLCYSSSPAHRPPRLSSLPRHTPPGPSPPAPHRTHHRCTRCEETLNPRARPTRGFFDFLGLLGLAQPADTGPRPPTRRLDRSAPDSRACPGTLAVAPQRLAPRASLTLRPRRPCHRPSSRCVSQPAVALPLHHTFRPSACLPSPSSPASPEPHPPTTPPLYRRPLPSAPRASAWSQSTTTFPRTCAAPSVPLAVVLLHRRPPPSPP